MQLRKLACLSVNSTKQKFADVSMNWEDLDAHVPKRLLVPTNVTADPSPSMTRCLWKLMQAKQRDDSATWQSACRSAPKLPALVVNKLRDQARQLLNVLSVASAADRLALVPRQPAAPLDPRPDATAADVPPAEAAEVDLQSEYRSAAPSTRSGGSTPIHGV